MYQRLIRTSLILGAACLLAACGFQLRGTGGGVNVPDDWRYMYLSTNNPNSEFSRAVRTRFAANGVEWQDKEEANYRVILGPERFSQRNLSLNADARAAEFELTMRSTFSVQDVGGQEIMPGTTASVVKQMENDPQNVVGKAEETRILKAEMRRELAQQIMRRISFFAASQQP
jgi:LPS-assembly lipoprotein